MAYYKRMYEEGVKSGNLDDIKRGLGQTDLFFLLVFILKRTDLNKEWLFNRCRDVQRDPNGHLDLWAREHGKSSIITFGMTIFDIINDPEITIGIFSHTKSIARDFVKQIKSELEMNDDLKRLWSHIFYEEPQRQSRRWSIDGGIEVKRTQNPKEATVEGHGLVDGMPTGRHFKLMIYDDVVTMESVSTADQIHKTTEAWSMSDNLGAVGGTVRYIGTRYHLFDTYSVMMDRGAVIPRVFPATDDGTEFGNPVLMDQETLDKKRLNQGPYVFSSQMLLNPTADKAMGFQLNWIVKEDVEYSAAMRSLFRFIIVDPAGGKQRKSNKKGNNSSDYTSMMVIGYGADHKYRILEMRRDRMSLTQRGEVLMELHRKWKPELVAYEEYGMQADISYIETVQKRDVYEFHIEPLGGSMKKELRILRLVPYFENGYKSVTDGGDGIAKSRIILPTSCIVQDNEGRSRDLVRDFIEEEYVAFPVLKHDDMIDCLARIVDLEEMGLIKEPSLPKPPSDSLGIRTGLRNTGLGRSDSWVTA